MFTSIGDCLWFIVCPYRFRFFWFLFEPTVYGRLSAKECYGMTPLPSSKVSGSPMLSTTVRDVPVCTVVCLRFPAVQSVFFFETTAPDFGIHFGIWLVTWTASLWTSSFQ